MHRIMLFYIADKQPTTRKTMNSIIEDYQKLYNACRALIQTVDNDGNTEDAMTEILVILDAMEPTHVAAIMADSKAIKNFCNGFKPLQWWAKVPFGDTIALNHYLSNRPPQQYLSEKLRIFNYLSKSIQA